ncbi:MAG: FAD-dependent oxidoreductase [Candidatus Eremiobacteraeota bacterium]|nr:FAD-dependent oxidoreductase [Candidatus Eremiobacteraeota bacterium]
MAPIAVIGAGPAGLTAAYQLVRAGRSVDLYEAASEVGGLARSLELWGQTVDLGPHRFFTRDRQVAAFWREIAGDQARRVRRLTRIYYGGEFYFYPLQLGDVVAKLGLWESLACLASFLREKLRPGSDLKSLEGWLIHHFGRRLYQRFFESYTSKLWGLPPSAVDANFAAQRIAGLSFFEAIRSALGLGSRSRTLVDAFDYPARGTGWFYQRLAERAQLAGLRLWLNTPVAAVQAPRGTVEGLHLQDGTFKKHSQIVSTMPLTRLVAGLAEAPESVQQAALQLRFRNTLLVYLQFEEPDLFPDNWLYIHQPDLRLGRITNFRNWVPELYGSHPETILACEFWCNRDDDLWSRPDQELIGLARQEVTATGLTNQPALAGQVVRVPNCYPIYSLGYQRHLRLIEHYLDSLRGLYPIGRYGAFKYNNQDHSIKMGLLAAEKVLGAGHDLWSVNTDYDRYQEG